ncbi:hypothetical protein BH24CHL4_BH24CHL4_24840 [soil metagenome]
MRKTPCWIHLPVALVIVSARTKEPLPVRGHATFGPSDTPVLDISAKSASLELAKDLIHLALRDYLYDVAATDGDYLQDPEVVGSGA